MDLKLFAPDLSQAELLGKNIMINPTGFYSKILNFALNNEEETFDPMIYRVNVHTLTLLFNKLFFKELL